MNLLVKEGKTSDEVVASIHAANKGLGVVAKELKGGDHGKAAVVQLLVLSLSEFLSGLALALSVSEDEEAVVVDSADEEEHLEPAESRDGLDGGNTVGDGGEGDAGGDISGELEHLRHNVANDGELGNAAVLELGSAVLLEVIGSGKAKGIPEAKGTSGAGLGLEGHLQGRRSLAGSRGEGGNCAFRN